MRMLVTGCAGFIGSHLSEELLARGHEVVGVDSFADDYSRLIKDANVARSRDDSRFRLCEADLAEVDLLPLLDGIDVVFHMAAQARQYGGWRGQFEKYVRNNLLATERLLHAASAQRRLPAKFVYASSSSIYGATTDLPTSESLTPEPVSPYGLTKLAGEHVARVYWRDYGVPTVMLRYFSIYGPRQRPDMAVYRFIRAALSDQRVEVFGSGQQSRDFTYIDDAIRATVAAAESPAVGIAINVGGGSRVSINAVIALLGELTGRKLTVHYLPTELGELQDSWADTFVARKLLGYAPSVDIKTGLLREVEWLAEELRSGTTTGHALSARE